LLLLWLPLLLLLRCCEQCGCKCVPCPHTLGRCFAERSAQVRAMVENKNTGTVTYWSLTGPC
jgi:hypothetical protein